MDLPAPDESVEKERTTGKRPFYQYLLLAGLLLLVIWLGWKAWRIGRSGLALLEHQEKAQTMLAGGWQQVDPDEAEALVYNLRHHVVILKEESALFMPIATRLGWLPRLGATLENAPQLMEMANAGTEAAAYLVRGLKPGFALLQAEEQDKPLLSGMVEVLETAGPDLAEAAGAMERVAAARDQIQREAELPGAIRELLAQFDQRRSLALDGLKFAQVLPALMGADGPRAYLIIAQNQDELRATGGFISGVGTLRVDGGQIVSLDFLDANMVDNWQEKPYDFPPQPLYDLMALELFLFRDANYWPDFPTSAEQALTLYSYSQDTPPLDGAIAIDQEFVSLLLRATGPVEVPELDIRLNHDNALQHMRQAWGAEEGQSVGDWIVNRKDFLAYMAGAIRNRLERDAGSLDMLLLADTMQQAVEQKHIQLYMRDPAVAAVLDEIGWDGRLENGPNQDMLLVVDTNVGYNKTNPLVTTSLEYDITLQEDGRAQATLQLHYAHGGPASGRPCVQGRDDVYGTGGSYEELIQGCYFNYLRLYVPTGTTLQDATRHTAPAAAFFNGRGWDRPAAIIDEHPALTTIENFFILPEGEEVVSTYHYQLPVVVSQQDGQQQYRLNLWPQAGAPARPVTVRVTLPAGATLVSATPTPTSTSGQTLTMEAVVESNMTMIVTYE